MLKSLYEYAVRNGLVLSPGYINKSVKAYVVLSSMSDDFVDILLAGDEEIPDLQQKVPFS